MSNASQIAESLAYRPAPESPEQDMTKEHLYHGDPSKGTPDLGNPNPD